MFCSKFSAPPPQFNRTSKNEKAQNSHIYVLCFCRLVNNPLLLSVICLNFINSKPTYRWELILLFPLFARSEGLRRGWLWGLPSLSDPFPAGAETVDACSIPDLPLSWLAGFCGVCASGSGQRERGSKCVRSGWWEQGMQHLASNPLPYCCPWSSLRLRSSSATLGAGRPFEQSSTSQPTAFLLVLGDSGQASRLACCRPGEEPVCQSCQEGTAAVPASIALRWWKTPIGVRCSGPGLATGLKQGSCPGVCLCLCPWGDNRDLGPRLGGAGDDLVLYCVGMNFKYHVTGCRLCLISLSLAFRASFSLCKSA